MKRDERGIALLMVLWIMALLTVIVTEFAYSMRTEVNITRNFKEDMEFYYLARAGVERALAELSVDFDFNYLDGEGNVIFAKIEPLPGGIMEAPGMGAEISAGRRIHLGEGTYSYRIIDKEGRINVNVAVRNSFILNELLLQTGVKEKKTRDTIVDSMQDWVDKDDLHRLNGAEDSYYLSLTPPYHAKDGHFSTVEELLLIKGVTAEIFYGTPYKDVEKGGYKGLVNFVCITGSNRVNINTAPEEVLRALGYDDTKLDTLLSGRPHRSIPALLNRFPRGTFRPSLKSSYFTIESIGSTDMEEGKRVIRADVLQRGRGRQSLLRITGWNDNFYRR